MTDTNELYDILRDKFKPVFEKLSVGFAIDRLQKATISSNRLIEQIVKLDIRYNAIVICTDNLSEVMFKDTDDLVIISDIKFNGREKEYQSRQFDLVDKIESFHQQVYSTISSFALVLTNYFPHDWRKNMNIGSIANFLDFLKTKSEEEEFIDALNYLHLSRAFRGKFIDHSQQHRALDWLTQTTNRTANIIYFKPGLQMMLFPIQIPDKNVDYKTYYENNDIYASPNNEKVYESVYTMIKFCLFRLVD